MPHTLRREAALRLRLRANRLAPAQAAPDAHAAAAHLCGLQAQDARAGALSFRPRTQGATAQDVETARSVERTVVRTWLMRGTLHFAAAQDVRWLVRLLGPRTIRGTARRRAQLGLSEPVVARGLDALRDLLADGPQARGALLDALGARGLPVEGQGGIHLLARAALEGLICYGPDAAGEETFVLLEDWLGGVPDAAPDDPLAALARRYLLAYAPAAAEDFAAWSGLTLTDARRGFERLSEELVPVVVGGEDAWLPAAHESWLGEPAGPGPLVRLLPAFDTYLLGWRSREVILPQAFARRIHPGGGILHPAVLADGVVVGRWKLRQTQGSMAVEVAPFEPLAEGVKRGLLAEAADVGRFLGKEAALVVAMPDA